MAEAVLGSVRMESLWCALGEVLGSFPIREKRLLFQAAERENPWFSYGHLEKAWEGIIRMLDPQDVSAWFHKYKPSRTAKRVGLILAANVPMVGFHDLVCVLSSGHIACLRPSRRDEVMIRFLSQEMIRLMPELSDRITFLSSWDGVDAWIATGSQATLKSLAPYLEKKACLVRGHKNSCAVLDGTETSSDLRNLLDDVMLFSGRGCRSVSKIYVPKNYDIDHLLHEWTFHSSDLFVENIHYMNNYTYQKAMLNLLGIKYWDSRFLLLREDKSLSSPIGVLHVGSYADEVGLNDALYRDRSLLQIVVGRELGWGHAHLPTLFDYADGIDTMNFLQNI
ncbi:MAG: hypothetical protein OXB93_02720 [Cytophagales bacterium]|nr:hypothetical protein [Cytophagales bacterium]